MCSCHFRGGLKSSGPEIFERNVGKLFPSQEKPPQKRRKLNSKPDESAISEVAIVNDSENISDKMQNGSILTERIILEVELDLAKQELYSHQETKHYQRTHYSVSCLSSEVIRMETGLPTKEVFNIVVEYAANFKESICYYAGWKVESISFEDQIFITLRSYVRTTPICTWLSCFLVVLQQYLTLS